MVGDDKDKILVIALGGNALIRKGQKGTFKEQLENIKRLSPILVRLARSYKVVITHGNGPQVGLLYLQQELAPDLPKMPLHACVAMSQGLIGYIIQQAVSSLDTGIEVTALLTRVVVDPNDPAFNNPTKPIGPYYNEREAKRLSVEKGWKMAYIPGKGWRRVVPSPKPLKILEFDSIMEAVRLEKLVIAVGGGGIPVVETRRGYVGVDAVVDKDLASSLLASELNASKFIIATDVEGVYLDYGKPTARLLREICARKALKLVAQGYFPPGSMGPKVEAAAKFAMKTGRTATIGLLESLERLVDGSSGTVIKNC